MNQWNDIAIIAPAHDIDISTVPSLRDQVDGLIHAGTRRIIVNCQDVEFIDSTGLAFLVSRARTLARRGGMLSLANVSPEVEHFLEIARLVDVLHVSPAQRKPVPLLAPGERPLWIKRLAIRRGVENLGHYRHEVAEVLARSPLSPEARFDMTLAASEALSNAYDHAYDAAGCTMIIKAYEDRVVIEVRDRGRGFELGPDEDPPAPSETRGRGIMLMRMLVDSVEIRRRTDMRGTLVQLVKLVPQGAAAGGPSAVPAGA